MDGQHGGAMPRYWRAGEWLGDGSLASVAELNRQCLEFLGEMAVSGQVRCPVVAGQPEAWRVLSAVAIARLATCPYLLADAAFDDDLRWRCLDLRMVHDHPSQAGEPVFTGPGGADFVRRVLFLGWYMARVNRQLARVALGMSPACADRLRQLRLLDLDWLALYRPGWVRPRWEAQPHIWRHLLLAAADPDAGRLTEVRLRGFQLMAAGVLETANGLPARARRGQGG